MDADHLEQELEEELVTGTEAAAEELRRKVVRQETLQPDRRSISSQDKDRCYTVARTACYSIN